MTNINESNSIITELNPEDAVSFNGGASFYVAPISTQPNHYIVHKFNNNGNLRWTAVVDNKGSVNYLKDDDVEFQSGRQPSNYSFARGQAKRKVRDYINNS